MTDSNDSVGCSGCGCGGCMTIILGTVIFIMLIWAIFFGLPINNKILNIDIIPPAIHYGEEE